MPCLPTVHTTITDDLEKGMYGPAQFFNGNFNYTLNS